MKARELNYILLGVHPDAEVFIARQPDFRVEDEPSLFSVQKVVPSTNSLTIRIFEGERLE